MKKTILIDNEEAIIDILNETDTSVEFVFNGKNYHYQLNQKQDGVLTLTSGDSNFKVVTDNKNYSVNGYEFEIASNVLSRTKSKDSGLHQMISPMPGKILKILLSEGSLVELGTPLLVMEAMKMEHTIKAIRPGKIEKFLYKEGDQVSGGVELVKLC